MTDPNESLIHHTAERLRGVLDKGDMNVLADVAVLPRFYPVPIEQALITARERVEEWDYETDPHGYCHDRPEMVALITEVERLRPDLAEASRRYFGASRG